MSSFALRLPDHLMEQAKTASAEDKVSINQMFVALIAEGLGHRRGLRAMKERASRADIEAALAVLEGCAPDTPAEPGNEPRS